VLVIGIGFCFLTSLVNLGNIVALQSLFFAPILLAGGVAATALPMRRADLVPTPSLSADARRRWLLNVALVGGATTVLALFTIYELVAHSSVYGKFSWESILTLVIVLGAGHGNDDPVIAAHPRVECPELELCDLGPVTMASLGVVPTTPWNTERECTEDELAKQIDEMLEQVPSGQPCILNLHCPPYASGLDDAPELDETLKPVIRGGRPSIIPVGSHAVRDAIKRYQPVVGLHGHIHESRGAQKIGRTLCVNPGSDYSSGVLRGAVIDLAQDGSCLDFLLTTG
jgi:Icc-related predicted phosphoesterase